MKNSLTTILSILLCIVLIAAAVCIGAYRGWTDERSAALNALSENSEIRTLLADRAMDAANLAVAASRHLPADDEHLAALRSASAAILSGETDASALIAADAAITDAALRFAEELPNLPSVQQSARDKTYVVMLTGSLSRSSGLEESYAQLVGDFNQRLSDSLMGRLAMLLGVKPLSVTEAQPHGARLTEAAEPRYPEQTGEVTDAAAVLSSVTLEDLRTLDERLDDEDALRLRIVTVDFLDGSDASAYAAALFERWRLDDDELLLLMAVGEDKYALEAGEDAARLLSYATRSKLLAGSFEPSFLNQQYDAALAAFVPALVREINKVCSVSVSTDDLFGLSSAGLFSNWAASLRQQDAREDNSDLHIIYEAGQANFALIKVFLIVGVLMIVFGSFRLKRRPRSRHARPAGKRRHPYADNRRRPRQPRW